MPNHTYTLQDLEEERSIPGTESLSAQDPGVGDDELASEMQENEDGSVTFQEPEREEQESSFQDNLAESLEERELTDISLRLLERIEVDKDSRKKRDEQYEEGLRRSGLSNDAPGGAEFEGASRAVHPLLAEAAVDYAASAIKELFPPAGPVRSLIRGTKTPQKEANARRKVEYLNWQLTKQVVEYRDTLEQILSQVPMGGSQFMRFRYDERLQRPAVDFAPIDNVYLPYHAANFYSASRVTFYDKITRQDFEERVESGLYRDIGALVDPGQANVDQSRSSQANDKIEGKEDSSLAYDEDGLRGVFEIYAFYRIEGDKLGKGRWLAYIITIDEHTEKVLAIYRNWAEQDKRQRKLDWWVEWGFIPWRGAYKLGLPHLIGGISAALTGALRALLDSAHINNTASAVKLKGGRTIGQSQQVSVTEVQELDAPAGVDDIRKLIMPMPFNPPSPVLFQLLGWLTEAGKGVVSTAEEKISEASNQMPVGTAMALIEQGAKVYSSIHARNHASQAKALEILCRINSQWLDDEEVLQEFGEQIVTRNDFTRIDDVQPVTDPNIFSETQRLARQQAVLAMTQDQSVPWKKIEIYRDMLLQLKVDDVDRYLPEPPQPVSADPVSENIAAVLQGAPLQAQPQQDHMSHLHEHLRFICDPMQGANPTVAGPALMQVWQHCTQHLMLMYQTVVQATTQTLTMLNAAQGHPLAPELAASSAADAAQKMMTKQIQPLMQLFQQAQQIVQSKQPPQPMDPTQATFQAAKAETDRRAAADKAANDLAQRKQTFDEKLQTEEMRQAAENLRNEVLQAQKQMQQDVMVELGKLAQGQQELQLEAEKLTMEKDQRFHDLLSQLAEMSTQVSAQAEQLGKVQTAPPQPEAPDLTPHLDRLESILQQHAQQQQNDQHGQALTAALGGIQQLLQQSAQRPNKVVRDPKTGDIVGLMHDPSMGAQQ